MLNVEMKYFATIKEECRSKLQRRVEPAISLHVPVSSLSSYRVACRERTMTRADGRSPLAIPDDNSISELVKL
ncbi:hypothetical protein SAMN05216466_11887 [Paraburkholderia phenazinium]|jgi:hypothetical protein|uniref:Uncharacterized protein n=1 Tax=Paraburkholderia phenazinium TaxID=60549 RepID=A0A1G8IFB2_9BURK|nr:hypothetical protein SAMN05216466_11887 [Paraburkholderia phenazinium]